MKTTFTKIIFSLFLLMNMGYLFAQSPESFNYQAVARDASGNILALQALGIKASLHIGNGTGNVVYSEFFNPTTNNFGLFTLAIGKGITVGLFDTIAWGKHKYYLQIEMAPAGGVAYTNMGTSQLLSVPYALHAKSSDREAIAYGYVNSTGTLVNGTPNISAVTWNASLNRYEITITDESYFYDEYVTTVTPLNFALVRVSSVGGKLLVFFQDITGTDIQTSFQFVTYKP